MATVYRAWGHGDNLGSFNAYTDALAAVKDYLRDYQEDGDGIAVDSVSERVKIINVRTSTGEETDDYGVVEKRTV